MLRFQMQVEQLCCSSVTRENASLACDVAFLQIYLATGASASYGHPPLSLQSALSDLFCGDGDRAQSLSDAFYHKTTPPALSGSVLRLYWS